MREIKRALSGALAFLMVVMLLPQTARAAGTGLGKLEAEDAVLGGGATIFGAAQGVGASGGKQVGNLSTAGGSYVQWNSLPAASLLEIRYASVNSGTISVYQNGAHVTDAAFASTGGWFGEGRFASLLIPLEIGGGDNDILDSGSKVTIGGDLTVDGAGVQGLAVANYDCTGVEFRVRGDMTVTGERATGIHLRSDFELGPPEEISEKIVVDGALTVNAGNTGRIFWLFPYKSSNLILLNGGIIRSARSFVTGDANEPSDYEYWSEDDYVLVTKPFETYRHYYYEGELDLHVRTSRVNPAISPVTALMPATASLTL